MMENPVAYFFSTEIRVVVTPCRPPCAHALVLLLLVSLNNVTLRLLSLAPQTQVGPKDLTSDKCVLVVDPNKHRTSPFDADVSRPGDRIKTHTLKEWALDVRRIVDWSFS